jgi:hypothetical protein
VDFPEKLYPRRVPKRLHINRIPAVYRATIGEQGSENTIWKISGLSIYHLSCFIAGGATRTQVHSQAGCRHLSSVRLASP